MLYTVWLRSVIAAEGAEARDEGKQMTSEGQRCDIDESSFGGISGATTRQGQTGELGGMEVNRAK